MESTSSTGHINGTDWFKGLRGSAITFAAGVAVELLVAFKESLEECTRGVCQLDIGAYDFVLPAGISVVGLAIEMIRRWRTNYSK